jgi:hypothetical protein
LIVIPEAVELEGPDYADLVNKALTQCNTLKDRFGIFDVPNAGTPIIDFKKGARDLLKGELKYGAAYYPFIKTSYSYYMIKDVDDPNNDESNVLFSLDGAKAAALGTIRETNTRIYNLVKAKVLGTRIIMPPSGAIAGIYAATDAARGVWKAPANVVLASVIEPTVRLDSKAQEALNVDPDTGKSINAIRAFAGKGTVVWGARTLAGNDNEWRYISVRRFFKRSQPPGAYSSRTMPTPGSRCAA